MNKRRDPDVQFSVLNGENAIEDVFTSKKILKFCSHAFCMRALAL